MGERKITPPALRAKEADCFRRRVAQIPDGLCYLEIGIYAGGTLCAAAMLTNENKNTLIYGIDPLDPVQLAKRAAFYKEKEHPIVRLFDSLSLLPAGCARRIRIIPTPSGELIREPSFRSQVEGLVGFLLIDGDHMGGVYEDVAYLELLPLGAVVAFHDYYPDILPDIRAVVDGLIEAGTIEVIEQAESLVVAKKVKNEIPRLSPPKDAQYQKWT